MRTGEIVSILVVVATGVAQASPQVATGAQLGIHCSQDQKCVSRQLCLNGVINTDGQGLLDVRITNPLGTKPLCSGADKVCCHLPFALLDTHVPSQCGADHDCVPTYLCHDGEINTSGAGLLDVRIQPSSCTNPKYPSVRTVCCKLPSCSPGDQCVPQGACSGTLATGHSGGHKTCYLGPHADSGVCCTPSVPSPLLTCPGSHVCVPNHHCSTQGTIITGGTGITDVSLYHRCFLDSSLTTTGVCCAPPPPVVSCSVDASQTCVPAGTCGITGTIPGIGHQSCLLAGGASALGECCPVPEPLQTCPVHETCLVPDLCYIDQTKPLPSKSACYVNNNIVGICCNPTPLPPAPTLDLCPGESVCLPDLLCQGDILGVSGAFSSAIQGGTWTQCHLSGSGLSIPGVCCRNPTPPQNPKYVTADKCGVRHQGSNTQIINNNLLYYQADFAEFPWQAIVLFSNYTFKCGGSLIGDRWVLTAAHCVHGFFPHDLFVRLGEWQVDKYEEALQYYDAEVNSITIHPLFNPENLHNDIAIVELKAPVSYQYHINTICLPPLGYVTPPGTRCFASGWGKDAFDGGQYQVILKKVEMPVVQHNTCQNLLRKTRLSEFFVLDKSFMCAGGEVNKDACEGDGGGPLACQDPATGNYFLAGITAWGIGCGQKDVPGAYVDVQHFRKWIDSIVSPNFGKK